LLAAVQNKKRDAAETKGVEKTLAKKNSIKNLFEN